MRGIRHAATIAGLGFGIIILVAFIYFVGFGTLEELLIHVNPGLIVFMVALELLGFVFYASAWYILIRATGHRIYYLTCQGITFASIFAGMIMPSGIFLEATRCVLGSKESGMKLGESTATVILHRILYVVGFLGCTALALSVLLLRGSTGLSVMNELAIVPVISIIGLVLILWISLNSNRLQPVLDRVLKLGEPIFKLVRKDTQVGGKAEVFLEEYHIGFRKVLSSRIHLVTSFAASLGDWACSVLILWIVVLSLGFGVSIWVVVITMAIGKMIQMTPIAVPGMLGVYETAITATLSLFSVPVAVAASAAILARIVTTWLDLPITGVAAYYYGHKFLGRRTVLVGSLPTK